MPNSSEHGNLNAHKYENIKKFSMFSGSDMPRMLCMKFLLPWGHVDLFVGLFCECRGYTNIATTELSTVVFSTLQNDDVTYTSV